MSQHSEERPTAQSSAEPDGASAAAQPQRSAQDPQAAPSGALQPHPGQQFPQTAASYEHPGAGFAPSSTGQVQYGQPQNGYPYAAQPGQPTVVHQTVISPKSMGLAYVLWFFLGGFGAHSFYLGKTGSGVGHIILTAVIILFSWTLILPLVFGLAQLIWWIVDACLIPGWTERSNHPLPQTLYQR